MITFDHIAVGAVTLIDGLEWIEETLNMKIPAGGKHDQMGTHNHVISSGGDTYLEIIAKDPSAPPKEQATWFGLDDPRTELSLFKSPRVISWVCRTENINRTLRLLENLGIDTDFGKPKNMSRDNLRWKFSLREDGLIPLWGSAPIFIEWEGNSKHVSRNMRDDGLKFEHLHIDTPHKNALQNLLWTLDFKDERISISKSKDTCLTASYKLKNGKMVSINQRDVRN